MKALVLGGSQFVGLHIVRELVARGHDVTVLNRGKTETVLPPGVGRLVADRTDGESMRTALQGTEWDAVFDVSGFIMVAMGSNMADLIDLLDGRVGAYVYTSSVMAYTPSGIFPWDESFATVDEGPNTYGGFKKTVEQALLERHARTGFPASVVRPAAIYGPDNNIYDMEMAYFLRLLRGLPDHPAPRRARRGFVRPRRRPLPRHGRHGDPARSRGRDLQHHRRGGDGRTSTSIGAERDRRQAGRRGLHAFPLLVGPEKPAYSHLFGAFHHGVLSIAKARNLLGFDPEYDFRTGHAQTFEWFMDSGPRRTPKDAPMDPLWFASYDFDFEAELAARLRAEKAAPVMTAERHPTEAASSSRVPFAPSRRSWLPSSRPTGRGPRRWGWWASSATRCARGTTDSLAAQDAELATLHLRRCSRPRFRRAGRGGAAAAELRGDRELGLTGPGEPAAGPRAGFGYSGRRGGAFERLRPLLTAHVAQDLGETGPMLQAFLDVGLAGKQRLMRPLAGDWCRPCDAGSPAAGR